MLKEYVKTRKQIMSWHKYMQASEDIKTIVRNFLNNNVSNAKVEFFVKECQQMKKELLEKGQQNNNLISDELYQEISKHHIDDLHDCSQFGILLGRVYHEKNMHFALSPLTLLGRQPILFAEFGIILGISMLTIYVIPMFL